VRVVCWVRVLSGFSMSQVIGRSLSKRPAVGPNQNGLPRGVRQAVREGTIFTRRADGEGDAPVFSYLYGVSADLIQDLAGCFSFSFFPQSPAPALG
jgi:hypothetical protein